MASNTRGVRMPRASIESRISAANSSLVEPGTERVLAASEDIIACPVIQSAIAENVLFATVARRTDVSCSIHQYVQGDDIVLVVINAGSLNRSAPFPGDGVFFWSQHSNSRR